MANSKHLSTSRGWLPWAVGGAMLLATGVLAGALAATAAAKGDGGPLGAAQSAVDDVSAGEVEAGCDTLSRNLRDNWLLERQLDGARAAIETCVDRAIRSATAQADPIAKERALLAIVSSDAGLTPSDQQFERVDREVAAIAGALEDGKERFRLVSYEVAGPLAVDVLRKHSQGQLLRLRGCHARAAASGAAIERELTLKFKVGADGVAFGVSLKPSTPALQACVARSFENAELGATSAASRVTVKVKTRP